MHPKARVLHCVIQYNACWISPPLRLLAGTSTSYLRSGTDFSCQSAIIRWHGFPIACILIASSLRQWAGLQYDLSGKTVGFDCSWHPSNCIILLTADTLFPDKILIKDCNHNKGLVRNWTYQMLGRALNESRGNRLFAALLRTSPFDFVAASVGSGCREGQQNEWRLEEQKRSKEPGLSGARPVPRRQRCYSFNQRV